MKSKEEMGRGKEEEEDGVEGDILTPTYLSSHLRHAQPPLRPSTAEGEVHFRSVAPLTPLSIIITSLARVTAAHLTSRGPQRAQVTATHPRQGDDLLDTERKA